MSVRDDMHSLTVLGDSVREDYDLVLAHEHVFLDLRSSLVTASKSVELTTGKVTVDTAARIRATNPFSCEDNLLIDDIDLMSREMEVLAGQRVLIIDVTPDTLGRRATRLAILSARTGVDIVMGCGAYLESSWPVGMVDLTQDQLTDHILQQFKATQRPSVIGEIGIGPILRENECRSLRAAATAQQQLDVPLYVHVSPWHLLAHEALDLVEEAGGNLERVVICHVDGSLASGTDYARSVLERGCYISFDIWGNEAMHGSRTLPSDSLRASAAARLTIDGFGDRILHSQDNCTKTQLSVFGGPGYGHLGTVGRALLLDAGLDDEQVHRHLVRNPLDLLRPIDLAAPSPEPGGHHGVA